MELSIVPDYLRDKCVAYFGNDVWFYIKHPRLHYASPIRWLEADLGVDPVEIALNGDIKFGTSPGKVGLV